MFYRKHPTFLLTKIGGFYFYSKHFSKFYFHFLLRQTLKNQTNSRFLSAVCLMDIKNKKYQCWHNDAERRTRVLETE